MAAIAPPPLTPSCVIRRTTGAESADAKSLDDQRDAIVKRNAILMFHTEANSLVNALEDSGIYAEADISEPRTLEDLADARRRFLSSVDFSPVEADLPAVLLSEG